MSVTQNQLLQSLPPAQRRLLLADCATVIFTLGSIVHEPDDVVRFVYFPTGCFISLLTTVDETSILEVGMIGNEGMLGCSLAFGQTRADLRALVQGQGAALRIDATTFRRHIQELPALRKIVHRYISVVMRQLVQTAACTRFHTVEQRLARWLLMTADRAHADTFRITQEFLAYLLGVRRVGVTRAAMTLHRRQLIHYSRGRMAITNRLGLEDAACICYVTDLKTYADELQKGGRAAC